MPKACHALAHSFLCCAFLAGRELGRVAWAMESLTGLVGYEDGVGRKPLLILNIYIKTSPTILPPNLFFSGLFPGSPLQMILLLGDCVFGKDINGIRRKSRWPSFFPF